MLKIASSSGGKKQDHLRFNGKDRVWIKTLHGSFEFAEQRFVLRDGTSCRYLRDSGQGRVSSALQELCLYYSGRLSYAEVAKLLKRVTGQSLLCEQTLWEWTQRKASEVSAALCEEVALSQRLSAPTFLNNPDIYDGNSKEVLVMADAIGVKAQRSARRRPGQSADEHGRDEDHKKIKTISTEMMLIEGQDGSFRQLCAGREGTADLSELVWAHLRRNFSEYPGALPIVAVTDGARSLRLRLEAIFGASVCVILDWYHLSKKIYQLLSMAAHSREQREQIQKQVLAFLWAGKVESAVSVLEDLTPRREEALSELIGYLKKHATEIIDYERRAKAGKTIGSGRMEKALDLAVGVRQKRKGMSWSQTGSKALALLKVAELNGEWDELWVRAA